MPSPPAVVAASSARLLNSDPPCLLAGAQVGRVTAPIWKRRSVRVVPLSNEETESDDVGLRPRKVRMTVSLSRLLGSIGDVLGNKFSASVQKK